MDIRYELCPRSLRKTPLVDEKKLGFGVLRTNHMFLVEYLDGSWVNARIVPYGPLQLAPGAMCFHYGQSFFEGVKAFRHADGEIYVFRLDKNAERANVSAATLCMPQLDPAFQIEAVHRLIDVDREFCPSLPESSLYIRPFMFASQDCLGVSPSKEYTFCVILSPSGPYYPGGFSQPATLLISKKFHRAAPGGTGAAKAAGNYAASLRATEYAQQLGANQVLFLDVQNSSLEEAGAMNHYHVLRDGTFILPEFTDTILRSITSLSVLELGGRNIVKARQEKIILADFLDKIHSGEIIEAGGFGTAAVVSPVGTYLFEDGGRVQVGDGTVGAYSKQLYEYYAGVQTGLLPDPDGWLAKVPHFL